jgi:glycosyltransferase involved in cell wall biosynthesis
MHVLYVVPYAPNPIRTRPYNLIRSLRRRGHDITLLTLTGSAAEQDDLAALEAEGVTVIAEQLTRGRAWGNSLGAVFSPEPVQSAYCWQPALARQLERHLQSSNGRPPVDLVHVEHLRGARYALHAQSALGAASSVPLVWDSVDSISHLFRQAAGRSASRVSRWVTRLELPRTEQYEGWLTWQFDTVLTTSATDRAALVALAASHGQGTPPVEVVPNGVDLEAFRPDPAVAREPATLVLSGKMSYHANVTMAVYLVREVMPLVWAERPDARVLIVGKDPTADVQALAADPRVVVTGTVPDLAPYLQRATAAIAPVAYGAGIQNKILEAMACGAPVVTMPQAAAALQAMPERDLLLGRDAAELAAAVLGLLNDAGRGKAIGRAGRAYVEAHHDWDAAATRVELIYTSLLAERQAGQYAAERRHFVPGVVATP